MGHACKNTYTCAHIHTCTYTCEHTYTCTHMHMHTYTRAHTHACAHRCTCMHARTHRHARGHTCMHTHARAHLHMCTLIYVHTGMHGHAHTCVQRTPAKENVRSVSNECRCSLEREGSRALIASVGRAISGIGNGAQRIRQVAWESSSDGDDFEMAASEARRGVGGAGRWREGVGLKHEIRAAICPFVPVTEAARLPACGLCPALHFPFTEILWGRRCGAPLPRGAGARPRRWG